MSSGKVLVAQGGGPTAVINQSLVGVVLEARRFREVRRVYGARHGVRGIVNEDFVDLTQETSHNLELVASTPSSALGSTRDKPDLAYCREIFKVLQAHEIEHFFYIGGNDSSDTVRIVSEQAHRAGYPLRSIHIPKTIDNDLVGSDHTPGYPSAARFVAQAFAGANLDNAALPMREIVIDRAMASANSPLALDDLKIIVLMVYWSFGQEPDALILDELCDDPHRIGH